MVHADAAVLPEALESGDKASFYEHVGEQLQSLLDNPSDSWISATAQASNLLYHAYRQSQHFGYQQGHAVNWVGRFDIEEKIARERLGNYAYRSFVYILNAGFYIVPNLLYHAKQQQPQSESPSDLRLGPFSGKPACQRVSLKGAGVGVCAQAFLENKTYVQFYFI